MTEKTDVPVSVTDSVIVKHVSGQKWFMGTVVEDPHNGNLMVSSPWGTCEEVPKERVFRSEAEKSS